MALILLIVTICMLWVVWTVLIMRASRKLTGRKEQEKERTEMEQTRII